MLILVGFMLSGDTCCVALRRLWWFRRLASDRSGNHHRNWVPRQETPRNQRLLVLSAWKPKLV
jgi:hypothetical protein